MIDVGRAHIGSIGALFDRVRRPIADALGRADRHHTALITRTLDPLTRIADTATPITDFSVAALQVRAGIVDAEVLHTDLTLFGAAHRRAAHLSTEAVHTLRGSGATHLGAGKDTLTATAEAVLSALHAIAWIAHTPFRLAPFTRGTSNPRAVG